MTATWNAQDDDTVPAVPFELRKFLQAAAKTIKIESREMKLEAKNLAGNALLQKRTTLVFALMDSPILLPIMVTDEVVIGRLDTETTDNADIDLSPYNGREFGVSRRHVVVNRHGNTLTLVDLGSSNGTYLNGVKLVPHQPRVLREGDEVRLGNMRFQIYFDC